MRYGIYILILVVICACGSGVYISYKNLRDLPDNGIRVMGTVTGNDPESLPSIDGRIANGHYPIISYTDLAGVHHAIKRAFVSPISRLKQGDAVEVIYPKDKPEEGIVNSWDERCLTIYMTMMLFFGFMFISFLFLEWRLLTGKETI